jgi:hypothetical protein
VVPHTPETAEALAVHDTILVEFFKGSESLKTVVETRFNDSAPLKRLPP